MKIKSESNKNKSNKNGNKTSYIGCHFCYNQLNKIMKYQKTVLTKNQDTLIILMMI